MKDLNDMTRRQLLVWLIAILLVVFTFSNVRHYLVRRNKRLKATHEYSDIILEISDVIIPKTNTPGAKEASVNAYIINAIDSCLSTRDKRTVLSGLEDIESYSIKRYSRSYKDCLTKQRIVVLEYFQEKDTFNNAFLNKVKTNILGPSFFEIFKDLTVKGYCMSKVGATQGLAYDHIPVDYLPCTPLVDNQRSWATA